MNRSINVNFLNREEDYRYLTYAKEAGFSTVGITLFNSLFESNAWRDTICALREFLDKQGLRCMQTHLPWYDILQSSAVTDAETDEQIARGVEATAILGAGYGVYHPRTAITESGYDWKLSFLHNKEALAPLLEVAEKHDVGVAVENIPVFPGFLRRMFYTSDPDDLCELVDSYETPRLAACWDTSHGHLMPFDHAKMIRKVGKRIKATHLAANHGDEDWHLLPLFGTANWPSIMQAFRDIGYDRDLNLEVNGVHPDAMANFYRLAFDSVTILQKMMQG